MSDLFDFAATLARVTAAAHGGPPLPPAREHGLRVHLGTPGTAAEDRDRILKALAAKRRILLVALNGKLEDLARSRPEGFVTADDAHRIVEGWPEASGLDPRWLGAVWRSGAWIKDGYVPSLRRKCHARPVAKWRLDPT